MQTTDPKKKPVGALLGILILLFPLFFVWALLRKHYDRRSRAIGFSWLFLSCFIYFPSNLHRLAFALDKSATYLDGIGSTQKVVEKDTVIVKERDTVISQQEVENGAKASRVGETIKDGDFEVTLNSCQLSDSIPAAEAGSEDEANSSNKYLLVNVKYKNVSSENKSPKESKVLLKYGEKYFEFQELDGSSDGWNSMTDEIQPLYSKGTNVAFKIPKEEANDVIYWLPDKDQLGLRFACSSMGQ
ncbi:MAG TPA: hypothetical protein DCQ83_06145 [Fibrobacteres bacterium]|jgi:hypothetical protein|nr:hypothetical protein [Fibrobacterota bacterium]